MMRLLVLATLLVGSAHAADLSPKDQEFFTKAAAGGMAEVEAAQLALAKSSSAGVQEFAAMMVKDHTKANEKLKKLAKQKNVTLPTEPDAKHQATKKKLQDVSGPAFDQAYVQAQISDHEATEALLKDQIANGKDPDAKAFAKQTLPTVSAHLAKVRELSQQMPPQRVSSDRP